jgi:signal transduction histidine kinase
MTRRYWPIVIAGAAVIVLGSYLAYTQRVVREMRAQSTVNSRIFSQVQRGLLSGDETGALFEIQGMLDSLDLPIVAFNAEGEPYAAINTPFVPDFTTDSGQARLRAFASDLERSTGGSVVDVPDAGRIVVGEPPLISWLRWLPWLQVTGGIVLLAIAAAVIRADLRAERERLWAAMARELAHQMGTPLSSLAGWIEVLGIPEREREELATNRHIADVIATDVERLERVSRRFELIGKPPALETVTLASIVEELDHYFRPRLPKLGRGIRLRVHAAAALPEIRANRVLLVWALENVIKNAVDALAGRGGRILIVAQHTGSPDQVVIHIADDGPGIPPDIRDRIFDPGVSTKSGGWGVGLSLTRRIVEHLHGGRVTVRARRSRGTVFDVTLPVAGRPRRRWLARA